MAEIHHDDSVVFPPPPTLKNEAHVKSMEQYQELYKRSVEDPEGFWSEIAKEFYWASPPTGKFLDYNFDVRNGPIYIKWMQGAKTNLCYNAVDRHVANGLGDKIAFYWEGNNPEDDGKITYSELKDKVCQFANVLKGLGAEKGDRVAIYMPMIVDIAVAMLACARLGIVHSIVFGGFSDQSLAERLIGAQCSILVTADKQCAGATLLLPHLDPFSKLTIEFGGFSAESLADRILDAKCSLVITSDGVWRGTKLLNLKDIVDRAVAKCEQEGHNVDHVIVSRHLMPSEEVVVNNGNGDEGRPAERPCRRLRIKWHANRDKWWHELMDGASTECPPVWLDAEDPLFMLYTSGSTGKPKGVLHTQAGYMLYSATTFKYDFDYQPDDIYWCTADVGWITGHTYVTYGPLANAATSVIFEGVPTYPDPGRFWSIVEKYKVTKFYTAPTAIRSLMGFGDEHVTKYNRDSLKVIATVGEPINPEAWLWYYNIVGNAKCAVVDTFWQTETGGHVITPLPGATPTKPGSATFPFFGVVPVILNEEGKEVEDDSEGYIVFKQPWPGIMRTVYNNHQRFETTYFKKFPGYYTTGDGGRKDKDGYIWVTGRIDDMVNVSAHLLSTAEIESALVEHKAVTEAAVVAHPHRIKGECTYCFVTLKQGFTFTPDLIHELRDKVRTKIGPFATPDFIQEAPGLPKTRSGKIMRRVLRKIAVGDRNIGDVTTMADETVVDTLFKLRPKEA